MITARRGCRVFQLEPKMNVPHGVIELEDLVFTVNSARQLANALNTLAAELQHELIEMDRNSNETR